MPSPAPELPLTAARVVGSQSNVEVRYILARGERHICLYAQRDIAANEELFFDYNYTNESHQLHSPTVVAGKAVVKQT